MRKFIPEQPQKAVKVPFYEDVKGDAGWQGHRTRKTVEGLKAEIASAVGRLGGIVSGFQRGVFNIDGNKREGFQIHYAIEDQGERYLPGRLDVAALPVRGSSRKAQDDSLAMALYMVREAINGLWFLQQLSPGYAPLMPWMLTPGGETVSQLWAESSVMNNLLPPSQSEFVEGEVVEK